MSTRALYGFTDDCGTFWVYVNHDGYPTGAAEKFDKALKSQKAWALPRFEADEFAAAFIAANKEGQGSVRISFGPTHHGDIEYVYVVTKNQATDKLEIKAFYAKEYPAGPKIHEGTLEEFITDAKRIEAAISARR